MKISREVKTGILAAIAIVVVIFGYSFMKGQNIFSSSRQLYVVYDNVDGLSSSANITINGLKVGNVSDVAFLDNSGKILVTMLIDSRFDFSKNSTAEIYKNGFIGGKAIKIITSNEGPSAKSGDTLKSRYEPGMVQHLLGSLGPLEQKLESVLGGLDTLVHSLNTVLDRPGQKDMKSTLADLSATMNNLKNVTAHVDELLAKNTTKLDTTFTNLSEVAYNFSRVSDSLAQIKIKPLLNKFNTILTNFKNISTKLNEGQGTAGKLLNDDTLYTNLEHASKQLEELIQDIKLHPRRYIDLKFSIFGGKDKAKPYEKPADPLK